MAPLRQSGAAFLQEADFVRFNRWLWTTRLRSIAALLALAVTANLLAAGSIPVMPIVVVSAVDLAMSPLYDRWLRRRVYLRALAYVQLGIDTLALVVGLAFVHETSALSHFLLLLTVVPASLVEWQCGAAMAALATLGHLGLLSLRGSQEMLSLAGLFPPATFFIIANQSRFYAQHLGQKNADLATAAESLNEFNARLEEEAAISGALLEAGQALTASLDPGKILMRLNEVVRAALHCDWSITLQRDQQRPVYRVAAVSGTEPDIIDEVRNFEFPIATAPLFEVLVREGLVAIENPSSPLFSGALMERWHIASFLCADLRQAGASVGFLAAGFNQRTGPFSQRESRLFRSIAQQAAMALENARLVEGLRAASRLKSEFIGTMSHELRSPLNVVIGYVDLLIDGEMGALDAEQLQALERVRQHALQLLELIQETLDINRLEAGLLPLDLEVFSVHEFVAELEESIPPEWTKPDVSLSWHVESVPMRLRSDRGKLKKVLRNLIHNALKFTAHGSVSLTVTEVNGWIDFAVVDTGIGISADAIPLIFEMFRQVDGSTTRRHGGVGLGLYIVKQLVRGLGGEVTVSSVAGSGSTFHVRLRGVEPLTHAATDLLEPPVRALAGS